MLFKLPPPSCSKHSGVCCQSNEPYYQRRLRTYIFPLAPASSGLAPTTKPYQTIPNHTKPYQTIPNHTKPYQTQPYQIANYQLQIATYKLPLKNCQFQIANYQLPITNCQLPITSYRLQIANCQLLNDQKTFQSHLNSHTSLTP